MDQQMAGLRIEEVADGVWVFDDKPLYPGSLRLPIRMVVLRLTNGDLILHSPTRHSDVLQHALERLGTIKYLVAPNVAHWMFVSEWQRALPQAITLAAPGLQQRRQVRKSGLRIDGEIREGVPEEWCAEIETLVIAAPMFVEVALFHKRSRTLVLTDLVQNIPPSALPPGIRVAANLLGITAPDGRAPLYLRMALRMGGRGAELAAARLIALEPERVLFAHGQWFSERAAQQLRRSLGWLTRPAPASTLQASGELAGTRVVITGASSGIGRAAALSFARKGASVVLAARRESILRELAEQCERLGGRALVVPTDVTDAAAMGRLAEQAMQAFGGIDVWINNAGTGVFGPFQQAEISLHRKTIEVNLIGTMHGAYAVLPVFLRQKRGVLINNISLGGWAPAPFAAAYTASKFGLRGFTASLRQELAHHPEIHVCAVFPAMIDTPGFVHGANVSGRRLDPGPLLYQPEDVAAAFVGLVHRPRDEVAVGWPARAGQLLYNVARGPTERVAAATFRALLSRARPAAPTTGSIVSPSLAGSATSGGWLARKRIPPAGQVSRLALAGGATILLIGLTSLMIRSARARAR